MVFFSYLVTVLLYCGPFNLHLANIACSLILLSHCSVLYFLYISMLLYVEPFKLMENDFIHEVVTNGLYKFCSDLLQYDVISSNDFNFMKSLSKHLPPERSCFVLIDIMSNNVKNPSTYRALYKFLENVSYLHHLHKKIIILG